MFMNIPAYLTQDAGTTPNNSGSWMIWIMLGLVILFFWWSSRSNKKREQEIREMRDNLVVGDEITTIGGIIGKIVSIKEETLVLETSHDRTRIRILKTAVSRVDVKAEDAQD